MIVTLNKWRDRARHKFKKREDELVWHTVNLLFLETELCCYIDVISDNNTVCGKH